MKTTEIVKVSELMEGDRVDLESCPYLNKYPSAEFEYAEVVEIKKERNDCIAVTYEGIDQVGYAPDQTLKICIRR